MFTCYLNPSRGYGQGPNPPLLRRIQIYNNMECLASASCAIEGKGDDFGDIGGTRY
jgi:hypothetical protein